MISRWDGVFREQITKNYRISFCTTCMNRLNDLKLTLPKNIEDNEEYKNVEFVLLDYNSKDGLGEWVKTEMMRYVELGKLVYYRTEEPKYFSMTHSRNVAFRLATGDIVNNVDADNYVKGDTSKYEYEECFASYLNRLANEGKSKAIFAKSKTVMHGRIGFFKSEFVDILGGYDELFKGYGRDDHDLLYRALGLGFKLYAWGGSYYSRIYTHGETKNENLERDWKETEKENQKKSDKNLAEGRFKVNEGVHWGKAKLIKNFTDEVMI